MIRRQNRGVALITAMLITAIIASVATGLASDNALDVRRTMGLLFQEQGVQVALGAEDWVKNILRDDSIDSTNDHLGELWASELPGLPVESDSVQGALTGQLEDLQGRFNVNNLLDDNGEVDPEALEQFRNLLIVLELDPSLAEIAADWIDADQIAAIPNGAEDPTYTGFTPPYRSYNQPLVNVTEIAAINGMDKAAFDRLAPHITALPRRNGGTAINVNTATPAVLRSFDPLRIDQSTVDALLEERAEFGFADYEVTFSTLIRDVSRISEDSEYFQLKTVVQIDTVRVTYFSVLQRLGQGGPVTTLYRSLGTQ